MLQVLLPWISDNESANIVGTDCRMRCFVWCTLGDDYGLHPTLGHWLHAGYPVVICTDDTSLFGITLSDELARVAMAFGLNYKEAEQLAIGGALAIFDDSSEVLQALAERCERDVAAQLTALDSSSQAAARDSADTSSQHCGGNSRCCHRSPQGLEVRAGQALQIAPKTACARSRL